MKYEDQIFLLAYYLRANFRQIDNFINNCLDNNYDCLLECEFDMDDTEDVNNTAKQLELRYSNELSAIAWEDFEEEHQ